MARPKKIIEETDKTETETREFDLDIAENADGAVVEPITEVMLTAVEEKTPEKPEEKTREELEKALADATKGIARDSKQPTLIKVTGAHSNLTRHALVYALESTLYAVWKAYSALYGNDPLGYLEYLLNHGQSEGYDVFNVVGLIDLTK